MPKYCEIPSRRWHSSFYLDSSPTCKLTEVRNHPQLVKDTEYTTSCGCMLTASFTLFKSNLKSGAPILIYCECASCRWCKYSSSGVGGKFSVSMLLVNTHLLYLSCDLDSSTRVYIRCIASQRKTILISHP